MTTTPRTDAEEQLCLRDGMQVMAVRAHFARKLEEELNAATELCALYCEQRNDLARWKAEQLAVEAQWDAQAVGKLLGVPLGADIRPEIEPRVQELLAQREDLQAAMTDLNRCNQDLRNLLNDTLQERDDLRNVGKPQYVRSEAIRLAREEAADLKGQLAKAQAERDMARRDTEDNLILIDQLRAALANYQ